MFLFSSLHSLTLKKEKCELNEEFSCWRLSKLQILCCVSLGQRDEGSPSPPTDTPVLRNMSAHIPSHSPHTVPLWLQKHNTCSTYQCRLCVKQLLCDTYIWASEPVTEKSPAWFCFPSQFCLKPGTSQVFLHSGVTKYHSARQQECVKACFCRVMLLITIRKKLGQRYKIYQVLWKC